MKTSLTLFRPTSCALIIEQLLVHVKETKTVHKISIVSYKQCMSGKKRTSSLVAFYISVSLHVLNWDRFVSVRVFLSPSCLSICCIDVSKALVLVFFCCSAHSELVGLLIVWKV